MPAGRFAPSPTGDLHLGNLRTALVAWLRARATGGRFAVRIEDLDPAVSSPAVAARQLDQLAALGLDWDGPVTWQSQRRNRHAAAIAELEAAGRTYPCWCSRREIREAARAPHDPVVPRSVPGTEPVSLPSGAYPGTCRDLSAAARAEREASGRPAALRLRADDVVVTIDDLVVGAWRGRVDDFVIRRGDGVASYNLAVAVDDVDEGVEEVIRGDDLLASTPRQLVVLDALGRPAPTYGHVPLVLGPSGERLAKRDGAVTLEDLAARGQDAAAVLGRLAASLGLAQPGEPVSPATLLDRFDLASLPRDPWVLSPADC